MIRHVYIVAVANWSEKKHLVPKKNVTQVSRTRTPDRKHVCTHLNQEANSDLETFDSSCIYSIREKNRAVIPTTLLPNYSYITLGVYGYVTLLPNYSYITLGGMGGI